jgi:hypothetical protein
MHSGRVFFARAHVALSMIALVVAPVSLSLAVSTTPRPGPNGQRPDTNQQQSATGGQAPATGDRQPPRKVHLKNIVVEEVGTGIRVVLMADGPLVAPHIIAFDKPPYRLAIDLPGVVPQVPAVSPVGTNGIERIRVAQFSRTPLVARVVVDMKSWKPYHLDRTVQDASRLAVVIGEVGPAKVGGRMPDAPQQERP